MTYQQLYKHKAFNFTQYQKYDGNHHGLAFMVYQTFYGSVENKIIPNKESAQGLHKPIIRILTYLLVGSWQKTLPKINQKELRIEKVIKRKGNKLYVKWKGCNNSFDSWIDKKDIA